MEASPSLLLQRQALEQRQQALRQRAKCFTRRLALGEVTPAELLESAPAMLEECERFNAEELVLNNDIHTLLQSIIDGY